MIVPTLATSGTQPHGITLVQGSNHDMKPIFMGYLEENIYTSGHFQAIQPVGGNIPIMDFLQREAKITTKDQSNEDKMKAKLAENEMETKTTWVDILFPEAKDCKVKVWPKAQNIKKDKVNQSGTTADADAEMDCKKKWTETKNKKKENLSGKNKEISCKKVDAIEENNIDNVKKTMLYKEREKESHKREKMTKKKRGLAKVMFLHFLSSHPCLTQPSRCHVITA